MNDWIRVVPRGTYRHGSGFTQVIDAETCADLITNYLRSWSPQLKIDFDHLPDLGVAGTITELQNRDDGVHARVTWTAEGSAAIRGERYKFISPQLRVEPLPNSKNVRPTHLLAAGLTNKPVMSNLILSNSRFGNWENTPEIDARLELCTLLGITPQATDDEIKQRLADLRAGRRPPSLADKLKHATRGNIRNRLRNANGNWTPDDVTENSEYGFENTQRLKVLCDQIARNRTPAQLRRLSTNYGHSAYMRDRLLRTADQLELAALRAKRKQRR